MPNEQSPESRIAELEEALRASGRREASLRRLIASHASTSGELLRMMNGIGHVIPELEAVVTVAEHVEDELAAQLSAHGRMPVDLIRRLAEELEDVLTLLREAKAS